MCSWYDEDPRHLRRMVRSLRGAADVLVAVDGAYATFPDAKSESPQVQRWALADAARTTVPEYHLTSGAVWKSEVDKRAFMFDLARKAGATPDDWFLIVDADMTVAQWSPEAREALEATGLDVAEVRWRDAQIDGKLISDMTFRSLFRAIPGLTVERAHWLYIAPGNEFDARPRFLWLTPDGHISPEPALDLTSHVTLHHHNADRSGDRKLRANAYYKDRDARQLESVGDWK